MKSCPRIAPWLLLLAVFSLPHCRPQSEPEAGEKGSEPDLVSSSPRDRLDFPMDLQSADASVNAFVREAMTTCASGEYDAFRLMWSVKTEPLTREEFEKGWQAVQKIRVRALQEVSLAEDSKTGGEVSQVTAYALLADVEMDPSFRVAEKEPTREVVLMLSRENDTWRLSKAPKAMREWLKDKSTEARRADVFRSAQGAGPPREGS